MASNEVNALVMSQCEAIRAKDLDRLMSCYSTDVVYFDVVPPLQYVGADALRGRFATWFGGYEGPLSMEIRDLRVAAREDMAVAHWLSRVSGTLKNGQKVGSWVRATSCCRRAERGWSVFHEHISLPVDLGSGRPATDLIP